MPCPWRIKETWMDAFFVLHGRVGNSNRCSLGSGERIGNIKILLSKEKKRKYKNIA
jgi:hypothetical protein